MPSPTSNQIRLTQLTGSLPDSSESALTALPAHSSIKDTVKSLASSIRRINGYDDSTLNFFADAQVFKSMASENRFVVLNNQKLFVSSSVLLSGTTEISTSGAAMSVSGANGLNIDLGAKISLTGSVVDIESKTGNINISSKTGTSLVENGTEVFSIDTTRRAIFHQNAGSLVSPDVEFDGKTRFDELVAMSGSSLTFTRPGDQIIGKNNSGDLTLSGASGDLNFVDTYTKTSTWADKDKGIPLATSATDWTNLQTLGVNSILQGLLGSVSAQKFSGSMAAALSAGDATSLNMNLSTLSGLDVAKKLDVFVNGQLQFSGSSNEVNTGTVDYRLDYAGGATDVEVKFSFDLDVEDVVQVVVR